MADDNFWESDEVMSEEEADRLMSDSSDEIGETEPGDEELEESFDGDDSEVEAAEEEEEEDSEADLQVLKDASLRLEQGNLYKMLLKHDLFEGVDADPRAIANVQRELKSFIRERLEVLVGLRSDPKLAPKTMQVQLPFSELEIQLLKEFLGKVTSKSSERNSPSSLKPATISERPAVAKIRPVLGDRPASSATVRVVPKKSKKKVAPATPKTKPGPTKDEPRLVKPPSEMTKEELLEYNRNTASRYHGKKAIAQKKLPMPDGQQLETMYIARAQAQPTGTLINAIMNKMGKGSLGIIEQVDGGGYSDSNDDRM